MAKIVVQPLKGFRDFGPSEAAARQEILTKIRSIFERYGFLPMETPALEYKEILAGKYGQEGEKLMYSFKDQGGRDVAMRYDLTVPLARFFAQYQNELSLPFKRYQIGQVWRSDRPQKGRFREFVQCDIDVVGSFSLFADAEVIACINAALKDLGIPEILVRINNRKLLDSLVKQAQIPSKKAAEVFRILDKLDKQGEKAIREELALAGINTKQRESLFELLNQSFEDPKDFVTKFEDVEGAGELAEVLEILLLIKIKNYQVDLTLARGLDYYTKTVFEIYPEEKKSSQSALASGGRYDDLVEILGGRAASAIGFAAGMERIIYEMKEAKAKVPPKPAPKIFLVQLGDLAKRKSLKILEEFRKNNVLVAESLSRHSIKSQMKIADKIGAKLTLILGQKEALDNEIIIRDMSSGGQETIPLAKLINEVKKRLKSI